MSTVNIVNSTVIKTIMDYVNSKLILYIYLQDKSNFTVSIKSVPLSPYLVLRNKLCGCLKNNWDIMYPTPALATV